MVIAVILQNVICISCALMNERKSNFLEKKLIIILLPVNNFYNEWTQLTRQLHALMFIANIYVCYQMF